MNKRDIGNAYENIAVKFLQTNGIEIICRNYNTRHGEIDIIGKDGEYLVFFEVKYRKAEAFGDPLAAVTYSKQRHIINAAKVYLYENRYPENTFIRFDCIGVLEDEVKWIKNAFCL